MRCLTLADELTTHGWQCVFWTGPETAAAAPALVQAGYRIVQEWNEPATLLVVDHYGLDAVFETRCRAWAKKILVIDDLADRKHDCDILVDQTFGRSGGDYHTLVPAGCQILTGADYALLRTQFAEARPESLRGRAEGKLTRVIVSMGATNLHNITATVLEGLGGFRGASLMIDVVTGKNASHMDELRAEIQRLDNETQHEVSLHMGVTDMAALMARADLAIGAGGTTSWERCCLGVPSIVIELADNQKTIAANLAKAGAVLNLGNYENVSPAAIAEAVGCFSTASEKLVEMSVNAARICDGQGVQRLVEAVENVCC